MLSPVLSAAADTLALVWSDPDERTAVFAWFFPQELLAKYTDVASGDVETTASTFPDIIECLENAVDKRPHVRGFPKLISFVEVCRFA